MYKFLKEVAQELGLDFHYARRDFANLYRAEKIEDLNKVQLFLDPVITETSFDEYGNPISELNTGHFMLLKHSDFQEDDYEQRYLDYIKPLLVEVQKDILKEVGCSKMGINFWQSVEIINALDENLDGLIINYQIVKELC